MVPEKVKEEVYDKMSPRYSKIYKKSLEPIFVFNHETLNGGNEATTYVYDNLEELKEPKHYYTDYGQLIKDVEVEGKIKVGTPIVFTGKLGSIDYKNKITSYGRLRTSKIIDADIDKIGIFKTPYEALKAGSAGKLVRYLYQYDDFVEKMNELQKFWLKVVTRAGVVSFSFDQLYTDTNTELYKDVRKIADSNDLTDKQKLILLTEKYAKYEKDLEKNGFSDDLKGELDRAGRVKISSILAINAPSLIVSGTDEKVSVTHGSLLSGFSEDEYIHHAIENRSLQAIKQIGVSRGCVVKTMKLLERHSS